MIFHVRKNHADLAEKNWIGCSVCDLRYPDRPSLQKHQFSCKEKPECQFCGDKFVWKKTLNAHLKKHHPEMIEVCKVFIKRVDSFLIQVIQFHIMQIDEV